MKLKKQIVTLSDGKSHTEYRDETGNLWPVVGNAPSKRELEAAGGTITRRESVTLHGDFRPTSLLREYTMDQDGSVLMHQTNEGHRRLIGVAAYYGN